MNTTDTRQFQMTNAEEDSSVRRALSATMRVMRVALTFLRLDIREDRSYPAATLFKFTAGVFPVFIYYFQADFLDRSQSYTFTLVGVAVAASLQAALTGFGARLQISQDQGTFETLLVEPIPWRLVPLTMNLWRTLVGFFTTALMLAVGVAMGAELRVSAIPAFICLLMMGALACMAIGTLSASLLVLAKRSEPVLALYGLAASLVGGALFSVDTLPGWIRWLALFVPHAYVISAARDLIMVNPPDDGISLTTAVIALVAFNVVVFTIGFVLFGRSLQYARRMGLLSGY